MNKILLLFFICGTAFSQQDAKTAANKDLSNAEAFSNKSGTLIRKDFFDIGSIKKCKVQTVHFTDLVNNQKVSGIRFESVVVASYGADTKIAVLDSDELDGLIKSIKIIQEKIIPTKPVNYTEITFKSRSGFEAGCFESKGNWAPYMKLEKYDGKSYVFMDKEDLPSLLGLLEQAKGKL